MMQPDKSFFSAADEAASIRIECQSVDSTEMSFDSTHFLHIYLMKESYFKTSSSGCCDILGFLTTSKNDLIFDRRNSSSIDWTFRLKYFEFR